MVGKALAAAPLGGPQFSNREVQGAGALLSSGQTRPAPPPPGTVALRHVALKDHRSELGLPDFSAVHSRRRLTRFRSRRRAGHARFESSVRATDLRSSMCLALTNTTALGAAGASTSCARFAGRAGQKASQRPWAGQVTPRACVRCTRQLKQCRFISAMACSAHCPLLRFARLPTPPHAPGAYR